ncbi:hypothetical protein MFIFM68171_04903 [Madurella fahalii]|uniref:Methyltransferase type 11 domain-containing protein n=1 Tax=Madurella fahalii TaxID=1157608 RepID=A0ABQ0GAA4_9PEZI
MAETAAAPQAPPRETTFRAFSKDQSDNYAVSRRDYHATLYNAVVEHHKSTGGEFDTILDVGCGPGFAVRALAPLFKHAVAIDPSEGMIKTAQSITDVSTHAIRFGISTAEDLGSDLSPPIAESSVDLLVAATCAHWFDMPKFWARAARVVKPGGTVAIWVASGISIAPTVPNHAAIQSAIDKLEALVDDYMVPGNRLARGLYVDLPLPWALETPVPEFNDISFVRKEWGTGDDSFPCNQFYAVQPSESFSLQILEKIMGTSSPIIRWREAHPETVGTEDDIVRITRREIECALREAGVAEDEGLWEGGVYGALLLVKRKA